MASSTRGKRVAEDAAYAVTEEVTKRFRSAIDDSMSHLVCAITFELPLEPVTAEDGNIYERAAIEEWLRRQQKSPSTNEPMGSKLLPAKQVRSMIESLIKSGTLIGDKVTAWQARLEDQEKVKALQASANDGDIKSMIELGGVFF
jgi:hypothetical protein